jgi:hypothetical protein
VATWESRGFCEISKRGGKVCFWTFPRSVFSTAFAGPVFAAAIAAPCAVYIHEFARSLIKAKEYLWTEYDPSEVDPQLMDLAFHAENEYVHCSSIKSVRVDEPENDPTWNDMEFFDLW